MKLKRNLKLYFKEKSTLFGITSFFVFLILSMLTFIPSIENNKGIYDEFSNYPITLITTNNYNVTYAASNNTLFYSQNKFHQSSLNDICGIKDYSNEYGTYETKLYNFIKIDYSFSAKIKDIQGISDNILGEGGETFVLCEDGSVYMISKKDPAITKIFYNVKKIRIKHDYASNQNYYLVYDINNCLFLYYFENEELYKLQIYNDELKDFYFIAQNEKKYDIVIQKDQSVNLLTIDENDVVYKKSDIKSNFIINENTNNPKILKQEQLFLADQIVQNENKLYALAEGIVYEIKNFQKVEIPCLEKINYIYCCGEDACIGVSDNHLYYSGILYNKEYESIGTFTSFKSSNELVYGNRNSIIMLKNHYLYLYNPETQKFEAMYTNILVSFILRPLFIFISIMVLFYLLLSFYEANKRYNRYFSKTEKNN